tara:strand:- start:395 stop:814 length:420 start_codon:yes stop_codon:yes gene_type:complete
MPKASKLRDKILEYINTRPKTEGYTSSFFSEKFKSDTHYCRYLLLELAESKKVIKRTYKANNNKQCYRFFSTGQRLGAVGMNNFVSPSIFSNNNVEPDPELVINSKTWKNFVKGTRIHYLMGEASKFNGRSIEQSDKGN